MDWLLVSNLLLWALVIILTVMVLALARQVGVLNDRVAPAGALTPTSGPKIGELTKQIDTNDLEGNIINIGGAENTKSILVLFISPSCPVCKTLVPTAISLSKHEKIDLIFASDGGSIFEHQTYVKDLSLDNYPYVLSESLGIHYGVSKLPFALLIDEGGVLIGKGLVNTREHLESLVEARETGISTLQEYMKTQESDLAKEA